MNYEKCEIAVLGTESDEVKNEIFGRFDSISNGIQRMNVKNEFLLGSPLTEAASTLCLENKTKDLMNLTEKLKQISSHSAYYLLRFSLTTPRLIFFLRGSPMWRNVSGLQRYDDVLKNSLETLFNLHLTEKAWIESSLPIKKGGIGIRHASDIALPCFLSSMYNVSSLLNQLLHETYRHDDLVQVEAEEQWCKKFGELPEESLRPLQSTWEINEITQKLETIHAWPNEKMDKARLLANSSEESGAWLQALPSTQLGTHLSNDEFRVAVALRLGSPIMQPHKCVCGTKVDQFARHGLSCVKASGTLPRHRDFNNLIQRALKSGEVPCLLEPPGCSRPDGKKPDGLSLIPWAKGKSLLWDYTCADTFALSYINKTAKEVGWAAKHAEEKKYEHYVDLREQFLFIPVATETSGVFGKEAIKLVKAIGSKITEVTHERRATSFLFQRLAISIQRGNVASVLGTIPPSKNLAELFYL